MNSTRNVDPDDLFDLTDLPPPFENSEEEEEEEGDENDSTLQKIRYSIQLVVSKSGRFFLILGDEDGEVKF